MKSRFSELSSKQLYHFQILADLGATSKASDYLGISQPALTQSISRLEAELGAELFDRSTRPHRLTASGEHVLRFVRRLGMETDLLQEHLELERGAQSHIIRIGCGARWMVDIIPQVIGRFAEIHPETKISIRVAQMDELTALLEERQISVLFGTTNSVKRYNHHQVIELGVDHFSIVARSEHPLHGREGLALRDLVDQRWIIGDAATSSTAVLRQLLRQNDLESIIPAVELSDTLAVANTLRRGDFLAIFTTATVRNLDGIEALSLGFEMPESRSGAIYASDRELSAVERSFIEMVGGAFGP